MDKKVSFEMEILIEKGRGYVPAEDNLKEDTVLGTIAIDSIFTPIKNVKYDVEDYRVEQKTDFEKLNIHLVTDGSITPKDALTEASKILIQHFMLFSDEKITFGKDLEDEFDEDGEPNTGTHWVGLQINEYPNGKTEGIYFDPYGQPPPIDVQKAIERTLGKGATSPYVKKYVQSLMNNACG